MSFQAVLIVVDHVLSRGHTVAEVAEKFDVSPEDLVNVRVASLEAKLAELVETGDLSERAARQALEQARENLKYEIDTAWEALEGQHQGAGETLDAKWVIWEALEVDHQAARQARDEEYQADWQALDRAHQAVWRALDEEHPVVGQALEEEQQAARRALDKVQQMAWRALEEGYLAALEALREEAR